MHRLILDNDGTNFFLQSMTDDIQGSIDHAVGMCPSSVTTYMLCAGAGTYLYPTKVGEVTPEIDLFPMIKYLHSAHRNGIDPFGMFLKALRKAGKETFITLRMNDVHNPTDPTAWNTSIFKKDHPEMVVDYEAVSAGTENWMAYCLDYSRPEVRKYYLSIIRELVEMYEIDGIQLDWMRFPRHLSGSPDEVWLKRDAITEFMVGAKEIINSSGRNILLSARIPSSLEGCRMVGFDIAEWTRLGSVDFLTASPFLTTDFAMPIGDMRAELADNPVPVYGCFEFGHGSQSHCPESLKAAALGMYDSGADGVYIFNFPCWVEYIASVPYHWLECLGEPYKCAEKPLLYSVSQNNHRLETDLPSQLPAALDAGESKDFTISIAHAAFPIKSASALIHSHENVSLLVNGEKTVDLCSLGRGGRTQLFVEYIDPAIPSDQMPVNEDCRLFQVHPSSLKPGINTLTICNKSDVPLIIGRINLGMW